MVRTNAGAVWVVRLPDRATWLLDQMPDWADSEPRKQMHAPIAPSSLALTVACNASVQLQASVPTLPPTDDEAEGTAAHWVARRYLAGYGAELPINAKFHSEGREWIVDADMYAGARLYERALGGHHPRLQIEQRVNITRVHPTECWGTPDARRFYPDAREAYAECPEGLPQAEFYSGRIQLLRVGDYKFGHRYVEVFENYQLASYAAGFLEELRISDVDPYVYVEMILVQPRCYHRDGPVRIWRVQASTLRDVLIDATDAADRALMPFGDAFAPKARTGQHCIDCKARHMCGALQLQIGRLVDFAHTAERVELPAAVLGQELLIVEDALKRLEARQSGLAAQAESLLRSGQSVPFYHMEPSQTRLTYLDDVDADELVGLSGLVGIELRRPLTLKDQIVTPTQALQLGIDEAVMRSYAHRPPGKMKLARDNSVTARKVFSK